MLLIEEGVGCSNFKIGQNGFTDHGDALTANFEILTPDPSSTTLSTNQAYMMSDDTPHRPCGGGYRAFALGICIILSR